MVELRRVRIDNYGIFTQSARGALQRIPLQRAKIDSLKTDPSAGLLELKLSHPELGQYFSPGGQLMARIDIADEPAESLSRPLSIYYGLEPNCNLACSFCGPRDLHGISIRPQAATESFLLKQIADAGSFQVQLTGGEIFIRGFRLFKTLEQTADLGLATILGTNGVWDHLKDRRSFIAQLAKYDHITQIKVSIDGNQRFHDSVRGSGSYDEAVRTLRDLAEKGLPVRINTTIFRDSCTAEQIEHVARLAKEVKANLQVIPERACGRAKGLTEYELPFARDLFKYTLRAKELREELGIGISFNFDIFGGGKQLPIYDPERPFSCGAGLWGFAVTHLGEVYPCGFATDIDNSRFLAGIISAKQSLLDIWLNSPVLKEWRHAGKSADCVSCNDYKYTCWGGCMVQAWMTKGQLNAPDPYCLKPFKRG
jgi:radical SAM protein with 4Fe4S-binding SPASM domain